ncbi:hypothetical protein Hdeb2414_s0018g00522741 [Helianthus debilis subsp. tardiflorus]
MTLPQFVVASGLYSPDESVSQAFLDALTTTSFDVLLTWWCTIGTGEFVTLRLRSPKALVLRIYDPLHRYLHRCIAVTIAGFHDSREWVTQNDLFFLHELLTSREGATWHTSWPHTSPGTLLSVSRATLVVAASSPNLRSTSRASCLRRWLLI